MLANSDLKPLHYKKNSLEQSVNNLNKEESDIVITSEDSYYSCQKEFNCKINNLKKQAITLKINIINKYIELQESSNALEEVFEQLSHSYQPCQEQTFSNCSLEYYYNSPFSEEASGSVSFIIGDS